MEKRTHHWSRRAARAESHVLLRPDGLASPCLARRESPQPQLRPGLRVEPRGNPEPAGRLLGGEGRGGVAVLVGDVGRGRGVGRLAGGRVRGGGKKCWRCRQAGMPHMQRCILITITKFGFIKSLQVLCAGEKSVLVGHTLLFWDT